MRTPPIIARALPWPALVRLCLVAAVATACGDGASGPGQPGTLDVARSEVTVSAATVSSGAAVTLTLSTRDAQGRPLKGGGHVVAFTASGGSSSGIVSPATDAGGGRHVATFTGVTAGSPTTIGATIDGAPVTSPLPVVKVRPGAFSPGTSIITVTPRTILADGKATVELITRDAAGNQLDTGGLQVRLVMAGGSGAGVVGAVTDHGNGRYSAPFTGTRVGTPITVSGEVNGTPVATPPPTVTVARGVSVDRSVLSVSTDTVTVNGGVLLTLAVRDSADLPRTSGGDTVQFVVVKGPGTGEGTLSSVTDHDDGSYTATFTGTRAGNALEIGVRLNGRSKGGPLPTITIRPVPITPQQSTVSVSAATLDAGKTAVFTAVLKDLDGSTDNSAGHKVVFTTSNDGSSAGTIAPSVYEGGGRYTATFTATRAGTPVTVGATVDDSTEIQMLDSLGVSHLPVLTVLPGPASVDSSLLSAVPQRVGAGDSAAVRLETRDKYGNRVPAGGRQVTLRRTGGSGVSVGRLGPVSDAGDGTYTAWYHADSAGAPDVIRATLDGLGVRATVSITVGTACTPGPISYTATDITVNDTTPARQPVRSITLPSGVTTTVTLRVRDARGCPITSPLDVAFAVTGGTSTGTLGSTVNQGDGTYTATFTGHTAGSATTVTATIGGTSVQSPPATVTVIPGDISTRTSLFWASQSSVAVGDSVVLTLRGRDAAGNLLTQGGRVVAFVISGTDTHGVIAATADAGYGTYTAVYRGSRAGGTDTIEVRIEGTPVASTVNVTVVP
jgi:adhesin/invasin